jgi:hypothetical protein
MTTNKFTIEVEEMHCNDCDSTTGHVLIRNKWTCVICGKSNGDRAKKASLTDNIMMALVLGVLALDVYTLVAWPDWRTLNSS